MWWIRSHRREKGLLIDLARVSIVWLSTCCVGPIHVIGYLFASFFSLLLPCSQSLRPHGAGKDTSQPLVGEEGAAHICQCWEGEQGEWGAHKGAIGTQCWCTRREQNNNLLPQDALVEEDGGRALHYSIWLRLAARASGSCSLCFNIRSPVNGWWMAMHAGRTGSEEGKGMCCWLDKPTNTTFKATSSPLDLTNAPQCIER